MGRLGFSFDLFRKPFCILLLGITISSASVYDALASSVRNVVLGGATWRIPTQFISNDSPATKEFGSVSLKFELPGFTPVNEKDFLGVYPRDDRPILTVKLTDDPTVTFGQPLLHAYIREALKDCSSCTNNPSSVGGTIYATFDGTMGPPPYSQDGVMFRLYKYPSSGGQFVVCNFAHDEAPLSCEMREKVNGETTAVVDFPIEYVAQGPALIDALNKILAAYRNGFSGLESGNGPQDSLKPACWQPAPGSSGAETIPLKLGPEVWHIPKAYASTVGLDQSADPEYTSISFWLKLPDLEPLTPSDPSPVVIAGPGNYIDITIGYDNRHIEPRTKHDDFVSEIVGFSNHIGKNAFIDYDEYQEANSTEALSFLYSNELNFFSNNQNSDGSSFPPDWFTCDQPGNAPDPLCEFRLSQYLGKPNSSGVYPGVYDMEYSFSRDYFSQLERISQCMEKIYRAFRFGS